MLFSLSLLWNWSADLHCIVKCIFSLIMRQISDLSSYICYVKGLDIMSHFSLQFCLFKICWNTWIDGQKLRRFLVKRLFFRQSFSIIECSVHFIQITFKYSFYLFLLFMEIANEGDKGDLYFSVSFDHKIVNFY